MAKRARNRIQQIGFGIVVGLIALAFVLVFGQPSAGPGRVAVAEVNGEVVRVDAYEFFRAQIENLQRPLQPPGGSDRAFSEQLDRLALETMLRRYILAQDARALGLRVSDEEVRREICEQPVLQTDGRCDPELFRRFLTRVGFDTERSYTQELRRDLLVRKLTRLLTSPVRISDQAVLDGLRRAQVELRLHYAISRGDAFAAELTVPPEDAAAFAEAQPDRIAAAYEARRDEFQQPESIRARHMLFTGDDALERAQEARRRLEAGEDFVALATRLSEDEATAELGGDLGFFPRGRMLEAFEEAAFAAQPRTVVGPVGTERGQHLIRVEERRPGIDRSVAEVGPELAAELLRQDLARAAARGAAERMTALLAAGKAFAEAALEAGLEAEVTPFFRPSEPLVPGIGQVPGLVEAALALTPESPHSRWVFGSQDAFYAVSLAERREPDEQALAAELEPARERLLAVARNRVVESWYRRRREEIEQAGGLTRFPQSTGG